MSMVLETPEPMEKSSMGVEEPTPTLPPFKMVKTSVEPSITLTKSTAVSTSTIKVPEAVTSALRVSTVNTTVPELFFLTMKAEGSVTSTVVVAKVASSETAKVLDKVVAPVTVKVVDKVALDKADKPVTVKVDCKVAAPLAVMATVETFVPMVVAMAVAPAANNPAAIRIIIKTNCFFIMVRFIFII